MAAEWTAIFERLQAGGVPPPGWLTEQQRLSAAGALDPRRAQLLGELNSSQLSRRAAAWAENYDLLCDFVSREGRLPGEADHKKLAGWVRSQRQRGREQRTTPERAAALEAIPHWQWGSRNAGVWQQKLSLLQRFVARFGHIPKRDATFEGVNLGEWVEKQLTNRDDPKRMTPERASALEAVPHWRWRRRSSGPAKDKEGNWHTKLEVLRRYVDAFGRIPATKATHEGEKIGVWVANQRVAKIKGLARLTPERIAALESVPGWKWAADCETRWQEKFNLLRSYALTFGQIPPMTAVIEGHQVGSWIKKQRMQKSKGQARLTPSRIAALESIPGWRWTPENGERRRIKLAPPALAPPVFAPPALELPTFALGHWPAIQPEPPAFALGHWPALQPEMPTQTMPESVPR